MESGVQAAYRYKKALFNFGAYAMMSVCGVVPVWTDSRWASTFQSAGDGGVSGFGVRSRDAGRFSEARRVDGMTCVSVVEVRLS